MADFENTYLKVHKIGNMRKMSFTSERLLKLLERRRTNRYCELRAREFYSLRAS